MRSVLERAVKLLCVVLVLTAATPLGSSVPLFAQGGNATVGGSVADSSGALIPGVEVTATNVQTGIVTARVTNEVGIYNFPSLQPGVYRLSAELPGFQTQTYSDVNLGGGQQVRLNFALQVSALAQTLEVTVAADTLLATSSSSVGTILSDDRVRNLPLAHRNALDLVMTTAGTQANNAGVVGYFAGGRLTAVSATRDGMNSTDQRYENGAFSVVYTSPDMIDEVRVIVAPVDVEHSRGSGTVQMTTRSGTNEFRGSAFWNNRNSAVAANSWFNNFNNVPKNYENKNQFGVRLGGPIVRNKTFFHFLYEAQTYVLKESVVTSVLTADARAGIFRYFPGVQNGHALTSNPTVDLNGNPTMPGNATGPLASFDVFSVDPARSAWDATGFMPEAISRMPLPNDFTTGDGMNTAGFRWTRRSIGSDFSLGQGNDNERQQWNLRIDHNFSDAHRLSGTTTWESTKQSSNPAPWPGAYEGAARRLPELHTVALVSTLSPNVVNEFRGGYQSAIQWAQVSYQVGAPEGSGWRTPPRYMGPGATPEAKEAFEFIPQSNGIPFKPVGGVVANHLYGTGTNPHSRGIVSPMLQFSNHLSWTRGLHAFKFGFDFRHSGTDGGHDQDAMPRVWIGAGGVPVNNIDSVNVPGLTGSDQANARNLLTSLTGSVGSITQAFYLDHSINPTFHAYPTESNKYLNIRSNEWAAFFKDDLKVRPNLTLNLGIRYDWVGVPYEGRGILGRPAGGESGMFGISGSSFDDLWQPGRLNGAMTEVEFVGKNGPNPDKSLWNDQWTNFAPAIGFSWSLPWGAPDKTILRAGYGISYTAGGNRNYQISQNQEGGMPGIDQKPDQVTRQVTFLADIVLPISGPDITLEPLARVPLNAKNQDLQAYSDNRSLAYIQNFTAELQREIARNLTMEVRYVGTKGTKLYGGVPINNANIFENGILEAFTITRAGGNAPLFDDMLRGLNLGLGVVDGATVTGSASLRNNSLFRGHIANGNVGQFAKLLDTTPTATGEPGGLIRNGGLPENFIVANPQFNNVVMHGNPGNSTYHSLNLALTQRLSRGFAYQTTYTWSRAMGLADGDRTLAYRNPRDLGMSKSLAGFHRTHDLRTNGTYELPFGPNRPFLNGSSGFLSRLVEEWQLGGILRLSSGQPLTITAPVSTFSDATVDNTPNLVGDFPKDFGKVARIDNGVIYFQGLQQIVDPARSNVTTSQATQGAFNNRAISDAQGNLLLVNPEPGQLGNLGLAWIEGPGSINLDLNLVKRIRIDETKEFELRLDAINALNRPNFSNPVTNINSTTFGRITSASGNRAFVLNARVSF